MDVVRYKPVVHAVHAKVPVEVAYLPAAQPIQLVDSDAPVVVKAAAHAVHAKVPVEVAYLPAARPIQLVGSGAPVVVKYKPAAHAMHAEITIEVAYLPAAQPIQLVETGALGVVMYKPAAHAMHAEVPVEADRSFVCFLLLDKGVGVGFSVGFGEGLRVGPVESKRLRGVATRLNAASMEISDRMRKLTRLLSDWARSFSALRSMVGSVEAKDPIDPLNIDDVGVARTQPSRASAVTTRIVPLALVRPRFLPLPLPASPSARLGSPPRPSWFSYVSTDRYVRL